MERASSIIFGAPTCTFLRLANSLDLQLLLQKCTLLYSQKMWEEFLKTAKEVVSARMEKLVNETEINYALAVTILKRRLLSIQERREEAFEPDSYSTADQYTDSIIPAEKLWDLHQKICEILFEQKRFNELENWSISTLMSVPFDKELSRGPDEWSEELEAMRSKGEELPQKMPAYRSVVVGCLLPSISFLSVQQELGPCVHYNQEHGFTG
ncbi:hypothetical protein GQR58_018431 [Nymphon striatum]|nr:hypothetical protein GQR58_018431 [Nymphon striatum]